MKSCKACHRAVGAGYAPPATVCYNEYYGSFVGAAYMPPVAAARILRTTGQTARNGQDRSLQTCRKFALFPIITYLLTTLRQGLPTGQTVCKASPLWGKLSPQVTDDGAISGHFPLIRRVPRHLLPKGEGFSVIQKGAAALRSGSFFIWYLAPVIPSAAGAPFPAPGAAPDTKAPRTPWTAAS